MIFFIFFLTSSYGLGAAVISNDLERCDRVSKVRVACNLKLKFSAIMHLK